MEEVNGIAQHQTNFCSNQFLTNVPNVPKGFLVFSGVIKWEHWPLMCQIKRC